MVARVAIRCAMLFMAFAVIAADDPKVAAIKKDLDALQGSWKTVSIIRDGEVLTEEKAKAIGVTITGNVITINDGKREDKAKIELDPTQKPATIKFVEDGMDGAAGGIYLLEGDALKLCWSFNGNEPPKEFVSKNGTQTALFVLQREKK